MMLWINPIIQIKLTSYWYRKNRISAPKTWKKILNYRYRLNKIMSISILQWKNRNHSENWLKIKTIYIFLRNMKNNNWLNSRKVDRGW